MRGGILLVRVKAPALQGRANQSVCRLLAKRLGLPRTALTVVHGARSRQKLVEVSGLGRAAVLQTLGLREGD